MTTISPRQLDETWKRRLDLTDRGAPELYESAETIYDSAHAAAIRSTLDDLGASAVFCVQGVPTIVILKSDQYNRDHVIELHAALWNQGLASLLLVIADDIVRAFSLSRTPYSNPGDEFERRCLIEALDATIDALALKNLIYGAESGRLWEEHSEFFRPKERVDQVLLENLTKSHALLCGEGLTSDAAQALLIQTMFIAYLEDREIIGRDYFSGAAIDKFQCFSALLQSGSVSTLAKLFATLRHDFNGDLFVAPCSFEPNSDPPQISEQHLSVLARFRDGREEMAEGQLTFWGYDFRHIPIELISAVYDRFLGEREAERRALGAYYTPMFLVDTVVSQVWETLPQHTKDNGSFLDPACGSGVFLVRSFQRLCEHWRATHGVRSISWGSLKEILSRLHGWDLNGSAVRVAVFSLYIALLEQVSPPDLRNLIKSGKVLPDLWGRTLKCQDFFQVTTEGTVYDVVIGNPPWTSRRAPSRSSVLWCSTRNLPMPGKEDAWAFTWKSIEHLRDDGLIAFLLPAMGFLHNHSDISVSARRSLIENTRIRRIINFSDLRFQLFDGAVRPAALIIFSKTSPDRPSYRFEYWAPKADLNLKVKRLITLSIADKSFISSKAALADPLVFKQRLWMSAPEAKLFRYVSSFHKIGDLVSVYGDITRSGGVVDKWAIGDGFKQAVPDRISDSSYFTVQSEFVGSLPHVPVEQLPPLALTAKHLAGVSKWPTNTVHRKGFEEAYRGVRILIPRGVQVGHGRLRATFCRDDCTFSSIIQGLIVPDMDANRAKLLTALLNSSVLFWFAFHGTASLGSDRPEIQKSELMRLPFPEATEMPDVERSRRAADKLIEIVDDALETDSTEFDFGESPEVDFSSIDKHAYDYFCLTDDEIAIIEDSIRYIIPAVQPHQGHIPTIWKNVTSGERRSYAEALVGALTSWLQGNRNVNVHLEAHNSDIAVLRLTLCSKEETGLYTEISGSGVRDLLGRLLTNIHQPLPGNFQLMPDFRIFEGSNLYIVKLMQRRFWLRSSAIADAYSIALDLQDFVGSPIRQGVI